MSQLVHPRPQIFTLRFRLLAILLVAAVVATGTILLISSGDDGSPASSSVSRWENTPNEDARGAAVAEASGAQSAPQTSDDGDRSGRRP